MSSLVDNVEPSVVMPPSRFIAREGYPFVLVGFGIAVILWLFFGITAGLISLSLPLAIALFFRDPERVPPEDESLVVSPADGRVLSIEEFDDKRYLKRRVKRVCIFLSIFNVHVNRIPWSGRIKEVRYNPGKFLMGFAEKASLNNEQNAILLEGVRGREVLFIQIAGFIARRIVCYLKGGEQVRRGERFGLIRFGSRMDLYLPIDSEILVKEGQKVKGGESSLARFVL